MSEQKVSYQHKVNKPKPLPKFSNAYTLGEIFKIVKENNKPVVVKKTEEEVEK